MDLQKLKQEIVIPWQNDPVRFIKDNWPGVFIWDKLEEIARELVINRRLVIPSGHGIGKTWLMARLALWFLFSFGHAKVITTAPTWGQVEKLLWAEIRTAYYSAKYPLGGEMLLTNLKINDDWFAIGFSTRGKTSEREFGSPKFQGYHSANLLVILDEAPGVEHDIWISAETLITGVNNKIVAIGNPTSPTGDFYNACLSPQWKKIEVSSFDHPNVKTGTIVVPGAVTREWVEERRQDWGEDSPLWQAKILGKFPAEGSDTLIPLAWAEACVGLGLSREGVKKLGVDVARFGTDSTVFTLIYGAVVEPQEVYNKKDTNFTTGRIEILNRNEKFDAIGVDDGSMGGGVVDNLNGDGIDVEAFNFGASAIEVDRFENLKAEIFWILREAIHKKELELPDDKELISQICSIKYGFTRKGKIKIESKDDMKKRGLKSPDKADSLAIAYAAAREQNAPSMEIITIDAEDE